MDKSIGNQKTAGRAGARPSRGWLWLVGAAVLAVVSTVSTRSDPSYEDQRASCVSLIRNALYKTWEQPNKSDAGSRPAKLYIRLDRSGRFSNYRITESSGSTVFDMTVLKAAANCPPIRGLTADFLKTNDELTFEFKLE